MHLAATAPGQFVVGGLQQGRADAAPAVLGVDGDLLEVPVTVELEHVAEPDDGPVVIDGHEQDAGLAAALLA